MDLSRIAASLDVNAIVTKSVAVFGTGGSAGLVDALTRSGVGRFKLFDPDLVSAPNVARQHHDAIDIGRPKVAALTERVRRINPDAIVHLFTDNFLEMNQERLDGLLADCDLLIFATDRFVAQARGNELALRLNKPGLWIGLYAGGIAGEIVFWHKGIDACYRCLCKKRYDAHAAAGEEGRSLDPPSDGCTVFDVSFLDAIAGVIALGLLTRGADDRHGRLIDQLGQRNFLQVQLAPHWEIGGVNPVQKYLGVAADNDAFFAWNTVVRADPDHAFPPCPDCHRYRPECAATCHGIPLRLKALRTPTQNHGA